MANKIKPDPGTVRAKRNEADLEAKRRRKIYLEDKKRLLELEKDNYTQLMLLKTHDGWWKMFGHSAVIYAKYVAPKTGVKAKLHLDTDYQVVSEEGYVSIDDLKTFEHRVKPVGVYLLSEKERGAVFELGIRISEEDYITMLEEERMLIERANKLLMPVENLSELADAINKTMTVVHTATRKADGVVRELVMMDMDKALLNMQVKTTRMATGTLKMETGFSELTDIMAMLNAMMVTELKMRLVQPKTLYDMSYAIFNLQKKLEREIAKWGAAEAKKAAKKSVKK